MLKISPQAQDTEADQASKLTAISVDRVSKSFKGAPVLHDICLDVRAGELLALLGPSGSGKTTLLRIIAGLETPDSGRIVFGGADTTRVPVQKRNVGFVFQHYALFKHLSIADNIAYGLNARQRAERPPRNEIKQRVEALLDLIKLSNFADRYPSQLSGGQRQRVALARALAVEPRVLLLDEPFGALDAQVRKELRRWLRDIHDRTGQTTVFVTHDQDEALELSDRVAVLHGGRLEQIGTPTDVQERPVSQAVVRFLGDCLEVDGETKDGQVFVGPREVPIANYLHGAAKVRLFIRPWQFEIVGPEDGHMSGIVKSMFTSQGRVHISVEDVDGHLFTVNAAGGVSPPLNEPIGLKITGGHLFSR